MKACWQPSSSLLLLFPAWQAGHYSVPFITRLRHEKCPLKHPWLLFVIKINNGICDCAPDPRHTGVGRTHHHGSEGWGQTVIMSLFKLSPSRSLSYLFCVCIHLFAVFSPYWSAHPDPFRPIKRTFQWKNSTIRYSLKFSPWNFC